MLKKILDQLNENERKEIPLDTNLDIVDIIPILLKRVSPENIDTLATLLKHSITPSIYMGEDNEIENLFIEIEQKPKLLFEKNIQNKINEFIKKRFEKDKNLIIEKTSDISKFVLLIGEYLDNAISNSGNGSEKILNIKDKLQNIKIDSSSIDSLNKLQKELIETTTYIETEINSVSDTLKQGKSQIEELKEKVKTLEEELTKTKEEIRIDPLTGLLNRRAYNEEIKKIESHFKRNNIQYAVVFFDLDHFKKINDTYGHNCGDVVLSTFGKILKKYTRDHDIVGRYGGEEFISIINFKLTKELLLYLKRIKSIVTQNDFKFEDEKIKITFSAGVAIRSSYDNYESTLQAADKLLYKAKELGRNKIILENKTEL